jgi:sugar lactone lactonase YvrE
MEAEAGYLWTAGGGRVARVDLRDGRALGSLELGEYDTEDVAIGEGAVWVVGAGTGEGGTLTRITP